MPFPPGRIGSAEFYRRTGLSKSTFFRHYRHDPYWRRRLKILEQPRSGRLHFDEAATDQLAEELKGKRPTGLSRRAANLYRACPHCGDLTPKKAEVCEGCGRDVDEAA